MIQASDMSPRILHRARSSIQHLFLDWQRGILYWLARGQPLQQLSLAGGAPWDAWNETWPGDLPAAMDSGAFSLLWSSALGESWWCLKQAAEVVAMGRSGQPCPTCSRSLPGQWGARGVDSVLSYEVPAIAVGCGCRGWATRSACRPQGTTIPLPRRPAGTESDQAASSHPGTQLVPWPCGRLRAIPGVSKRDGSAAVGPEDAGPCAVCASSRRAGSGGLRGLGATGW